MKINNKKISVLLMICMITFIMSSFKYSVYSATEFTYSYKLIGNTGAIITVESGQSNISAVTSNTDLVHVSTSGSKITVKANDGAVGVATISIMSGTTKLGSLEVPVGYTTFIFDENKLIVYDGESVSYEVYGINKLSEIEEVVYGQEIEGGLCYTNDTNYSLNVNIKKKGGTYVFSGKGNDMSISVNKAATGEAKLLFANLELTSKFTSPVTIKKESSTTVTMTALEGTYNKLQDSQMNNADIYGSATDGGNSSNPYYAESSVIKCKSYANVTINGKGKIDIIANAKNAIKVGNYGNLTIENVELNINSENNGISDDNILNINSGKITIVAKNDAIKSEPDYVDETAGCSSIINIKSGTFKITSNSDAIKTSKDIYISGGTFDIKTGNGYKDKTSQTNGISAKGLKATTSDETKGSTNTISITGGTFNFDTADDALHSDSYIDILGGTINIYSGDDAIHAATIINVGNNKASDDSVKINIKNSYEGLEAGTVIINAGTHTITSTDDGINSAGGSDSTGGNGGEGFNPGGNNNRPGFNGTTQSDSEYALNVTGGNITVIAGGDGLDANGNINLTGGKLIVWGAASNSSSNDNSPLDCDGSLNINGATVFAAGSGRMAKTPSSNSQPYVKSSNTVTTGKTINIKYNGSVKFNIKAIENVNYIIYSSKEMVSSTNWSIVIDDSEIISTTKKGWVKENSKWYYYDENGNAKKGWAKISDKWYYFDTAGVMVTGWKQISSKWYYFETSGVMVAGWKQIDSKWYYFETSGAMVTGWKQIGAKWYYFENSGAMVIGWNKISSKWYYFETSGVMVTGWNKINSKWYYFETSGTMVTGWKQISGKWYYFSNSGEMISNKTIVIDGKSYSFDLNGVWIK